MKVTFQFSSARRAFLLEPEDDLETLVLSEMAAQAAKGSTISLNRIETNKDTINGFKVEIKVNGAK